MEQWQIRIAKDGLQDEFEKRLSQFKEREADDRIDAQLTSEFVLQSWEKLPDTIAATKPLSVGAYWVLLGSLVDATAELQELGIEASPASLFSGLRFPLYVTLAAAQIEAEEDDASEVDAIHVRRAGVWLFSLGWPFCCAEEP